MPLVLEGNEQRHKEVHCQLYPMLQRKVKVQAYPLQMTEIPDRPFDKIAIDLVTECETSTSGNKHILTIIDHLTGLQKPSPYWIGQLIPSITIYQYTCVPGTSSQTMAQNSKTPLWTRH